MSMMNVEEYPWGLVEGYNLDSLQESDLEVTQGMTEMSKQDLSHAAGFLILSQLYSYQPEANFTNEGPVSLESLMGSLAIGPYGYTEGGFGDTASGAAAGDSGSGAEGAGGGSAGGDAGGGGE